MTEFLKTAQRDGQGYCGAASTPLMLASVRNAQEAKICVAGGVDLIDAKEPAAGALGAVSLKRLHEIRQVVPHTIPISATLGDDVHDTREILEAAAARFEAGADIIKIGLFPDVDVSRLAREIGKQRRLYAGSRPDFVAVILADLISPDAFTKILRQLGRAGFWGVMLDTADKRSGGLGTYLSLADLKGFIQTAQKCGLNAGLAGSLTLEGLPAILKLGPDIVGFRGALAALEERTQDLDAKSVTRVRQAIPRRVGVQTAVLV